MQRFTQDRGPDTPDEIWLCEHFPVYTYGKGTPPPLLPPKPSIPLLPTDRGGKITYHGPGQAVVYTLLDTQRLGLSPKGLVTLLEDAVISCLASCDLVGQRMAGAPGVYVGERKIASLGLRITRRGAYHGVAVNVDMDLGPFAKIAICGIEGLMATSVKEEGGKMTCGEMQFALASRIKASLKGLAGGKNHVPG